MHELTQPGIDLIRLKIELELGSLVVGDTLPRSRQPSDPEPLLLVSRHSAGRSLFFRHDVPEALRERLRVSSDAALDDSAAVRSALESVAPVTKVIPLRWYVVERTPDPAEFPDVIRRDGRFVALTDRKVASQAWADKVDERAEEVAVATVPAYRGRGFARQVIAAWMHDVQKHSKIGFYSHLAANEASQALARSVGVTWIADEVEYIHES